MDGVMYREAGVEVAVNNDLAVSGSLSKSAIRCECAIYAISHGECSTWGRRFRGEVCEAATIVSWLGEMEECNGELS
jgi:hypothetical protein